MPKTCPPGVFCIEKFTLFILFLILVGLYFLIKNISLNINLSNNPTKQIDINLNEERITSQFDNLNQHFNVSTQNQKTRFEDPYNPPMKQNPYMVPINIKTQGQNLNYSQIGILTRLSNNEQILPLFGRPLISNRDKWNFYTMNDKTNMIKLPIIYKNKRSTSEYGCDNLYNGDIVKVEGYNDNFKVTIYDNENLNYLAY
jgi:hypothetical protein